MAEREAVLFANEVFYRAFAGADVEAMDAAWARGTAVACVHPGWTPLLDRRAIMDSWRGILLGPDRPSIRCLNPRAFVYGEVAFVVCYERVDGDYLIATNVFVVEDGSWKVVHHQAGPTFQAPRDIDEEGTAPVH